MRPYIVPLLTVLPSAPTQLSRGVHCYVDQPSGETVYYAITSTGDLLNGEQRRRHPSAEEVEAFIVREMWRDLNRQDPIIGRPQLSLVVDGPPA